MGASWHEPSLIVFDDLDSLVYAETETDNSAKGKQLAHHLIQQLRELSETQNVFYIVTSIDRSSIHPLLMQSNLFGKTMHLKPPSKKERIEVLIHTNADFKQSFKI